MYNPPPNDRGPPGTSIVPYKLSHAVGSDVVCGNSQAECMCSPIGGEGDESMAAGVGDSTTVGDGGSVEAGGGDALMCCVG